MAVYSQSFSGLGETLEPQPDLLSSEPTSIIGAAGQYGGCTGGDGITLQASTTFVNGPLGTISGGEGGVGSTGFSSYWAAGEIHTGILAGAGGTGGTGVYLVSASLVNEGSITGGRGGVGGLGEFGAAQGPGGAGGVGVLINGGYLYNEGIIAGGGSGGFEPETLGASDSIHFSGSGTLKIGPSSTFVGRVDANASDELLLSGSADNPISFGTEFNGFGTISFAAGASWTLEGDEEAFLNGPTISGFGAADSIIIENIPVSSGISLDASGLLLTDGSLSANISIFQENSSPIEMSSVNAVEEQITAPCFCRGTKIMTWKGAVAVENLRIGDLVQTKYVGFQPIKWIGERRYQSDQIKVAHLTQPVCIKANAISKNIPSRDLWVSPDHGIYLEEHLIHAWLLCNGRTIIQDSSLQPVHYFHIELEEQEIIFAENLPVETFLDLNCRGRFDNALDYYERYQSQECSYEKFPRYKDGFELYRIQSQIYSRAGITRSGQSLGPLRGNIDECTETLIRGWAQDEIQPEEPVILQIVSNDKVVDHILANTFRPDLRAAGIGSGCHGFSWSVAASKGTRLIVRRLIDRMKLKGPPLGIF